MYNYTSRLSEKACLTWEELHGSGGEDDDDGITLPGSAIDESTIDESL